MLTVMGLRHPGAGYYLADHLEELPAGLGQRPEGWWGRQAEALGLTGVADPPGMAALCSGALPAGPRLAKREVLAYDLVVAAPKEASLLLAADGQALGQLLAAHGHGVGAALRYLEERAASVLVAGPGGRHPEPVKGIAAHLRTHASSRAGDPHLHTHCLLANVAQGPDGRFRAIDGRGLRAHAMAADALYRAELGYQLQRRLGVESPQLGADLRLGLRAAFSSRAAELAQGGARAPAMAVEQRDVQLARWRGRLELLGVDWRGGELLGNALEPRRRRIDEHQLAAALLGDDRRRGRRDAVEAWAKAAGPIPALEVERSVDLVLGGRGEGVGVGEEVLMPRRLLAPARALAQLGARPVDRDGLESWTRRAAIIDRDRATRALGSPERARVRA